MRPPYGDAVSRGRNQIRTQLEVQAFDDAVRDAVVLAGFGEAQAFGVDKNHSRVPQFEKLNCVDDLPVLNFHGHIVFVQFAAVKRKTITMARSSRESPHSRWNV